MFAVFFVWFASVVPYLTAVFGVAALVCLIALLIWFISVASHNDTYTNKKPYPISVKSGRWLLGFAVTFALIWATIPSEKTVYLMGGAYIGQSVVQSEAGNKVKKIMESKLDEYLDDFESKAKAKVKSTTKAVVETAKEKAE